ncbi:hypothetical protein [Streptomyces sp. NPDC007088]|uniref:hypothetical protein n=1 Tax=Streptomyces sp. NPDC007088 TaxID=3364773 RepID=UPI0036AFC955
MHLLPPGPVLPKAALLALSLPPLTLLRHARALRRAARTAPPPGPGAPVPGIVTAAPVPPPGARPAASPQSSLEAARVRAEAELRDRVSEVAALVAARCA